MLAAARGWFAFWWLRVPEPREYSVLFTLLYSIALYTGVATLVRPPSSLSEAVGGPMIMSSVGGLLIFGAVVAMLGGMIEHWRTERIGIWTMAGALLLYGAIVLGLHVTQPGSRLTQLGVIGMALLSFAFRYMMIWRFSKRPRG